MPDGSPTTMMDCLAHLPLFHGIPASGLARVARVAHAYHFPAGASIFNEGSSCAGFYVVLEGLVRIYRVGQAGRLHTLSLLRPVASFNEVCAADGGANPFNATAVTDVRVMVIGRQQLLRLMSEEPALMSNYVQALAHINREYIERLEDMTFRTIPSRLAKLFLHETTYADQIAEAPTRLSQEEIAAILGTTREVVGRALRQLLNAGLLRKQGRAIYIHDRPALECLANSNELPELMIDK